MSAYSVLFFGSHPDLENDDCWYGEDFNTLEEALACYQRPVRSVKNCPASDVEWIELDGAEGPDGENLMRRNPSFRRARNDGEWQREHATQAGMAFGCDGYNDAMGW